ncbi:calpain [Coprinopsis cinerea AmutBmut pab1-1]|nr:calpain [Coprinopsis cinerea AmutBmut pab1-1]
MPLPSSGTRNLKEPLSALLVGITATCLALGAYATLRNGKPLKARVKLTATIRATLERTSSYTSKSGGATSTLKSAATKGGSDDDISGEIGLLLGGNLEAAIQECKERVERISRECRAENRKFRDLEFDLESDKELCLYTLSSTRRSLLCPADTIRITDLWEHPKFFADHANPNDIRQGTLGDCWFLSALSTISGLKGLVSKLCVARDEEVGVYGFIFCKHGIWTPVIVDDLLYSQMPIYENLRTREQQICRQDKDAYNAMARKGGEGLFFAKSGYDGETWVPLIEKAFAKLHGTYEALSGGQTAQALEDLTGGVNESWKIMDILDTDRFWEEELSKAGVDRFFDVSLARLTKNASQTYNTENLVFRHAYSVLRARQVCGRRFVVIRNPWGKTIAKWNGRWGDGSKEWTELGREEREEILRVMEYKLGDYGTLMMEYSDFLTCWHYIQRVIVFDSSWRASQIWIEVPPKPDGFPWQFGEVMYYFTLSKPSPVHIVLSQIDWRAFEDISGRVWFLLDFYVCKRGEKDWRGVSALTFLWERSVSCYLETLEEGEYVVYPRVQRYFGFKKMCYFKEALQEKKWDERKLARALTRRAQCFALAENADHNSIAPYLPTAQDAPRPPNAIPPPSATPSTTNNNGPEEETAHPDTRNAVRTM